MLNSPLIFLLDTGTYRVRWDFKNVHVGIELTGQDTADVVVIKQHEESA